MKIPRLWLAVSLFAAGLTGIVCTSEQPTAREQMKQARLSEESDLEQRYSVLRREWERIKREGDTPPGGASFVQMIDARLQEAEQSLELMKEAKPLEWAEHRGRLGRTLDDLTRTLADAQLDEEQNERGNRRT